MEKVDARELAEHVAKALVNIETAPKAKHVRGIVLYSWNFSNSSAFWTQLLLEPVFSDEIVCFKALIVIHKLLRDGHPQVLKDALQQTRFFDNCLSQAAKNARNYGELIRSYVNFIKTKLEFHKQHPEFSGNMSYSDYLSMKKAVKLDESWDTVIELLQLQEGVLAMANRVFTNFRDRSNNECRISSLVPLVEESYGIYQFLLSMLRAMHAAAPDISVFADLRDKFNEQHRQLAKFYYDCQGLRYLTSLIPVPELDPNPPSLYDPAKARAPMLPARRGDDDGGAALAAMAAEIADLKEQIRRFVERYEQDQARIAELFMRNQSLEHDLATVHSLLTEEQRRNAELTALLQRQNEEYGPLKTKMDRLQELYTAMRTEHLPLLQQKQQFVAMREQFGKAKQAYEQLQKAYQNESAERKNDQQQYQQQSKLAEDSYNTELERLRRQLKDQANQMESLGQSRGAEVETLVRQYNQEKAALEHAHQEKIHEIDQLRAEVNQLKAATRQQQQTKDEEINVLQVGLDESLERVHDMQQKLDAEQQLFDQKLRSVYAEHANEMSRLLDDVLDGCARKIDENASQFESPLFVGLTSATAESAAMAAEKASSVCADFAAAVQTWKAGGAPAKVLSEANSLATSIEQLVANAKGALRIAGDDRVIDDIGTSLRVFAKASKDALLAARPTDGAGAETVEAQRVEAQRAADLLLKALEGLMVKDMQLQQSDDIGDIVEREMLAAAKAIEDAALRLHELMRQPKQSVTMGEFNVNQSILEATMGITSAIGTLIRAATLAQQEIVAKGRGTATSAQFYKKNHRWTEGLVSAAKTVALATTALVEAADAAVRGAAGIEPLVVAAHEVAAATAQLVAASRVKADRGSATQSNLENASKSVADATKALVAAAKDAALRKLEETDKVDLAKLTVGQIKRQDMEQQVKILTLEKELTNARRRLAEMRKQSYHADVDEAESTAASVSVPAPGPVSEPTAVAQARQSIQDAVGTPTPTINKRASIAVPLKPNGSVSVPDGAAQQPAPTTKRHSIAVPANNNVIDAGKPAVAAKPTIPPKPAAVRPPA